jgi:hypothetical protein
MEEYNISIRTCKDCNERKPLTDFPKNSTATMGRTTQCKECLKIYSRKKRAEKELERNKFNLYEGDRRID